MPFDVHVLNHTLGTSPRNADVGIVRLSGTIGQTSRDSQVVPRTKLSVSDTFYRHTTRHDLKLGGEFAFTAHDVDSHVFEYGVFRFTTDAPFDSNIPSTWPTSFEQQTPTKFSYDSRELALFLQDDWRLGSRIRINAGVRYDLDLDFRLNDFYGRVLDEPSTAALGQFISRSRGTDTNNVQPRLGATWDTRGDGRIIVRGASGLYVTRNRPWFQLRAMNQAGSSVVRITDAALLRNYPSIPAVLGGRSLDSYIATGGPRQLGTVIPDDFVQPYAVNTTAGVGWQVNSSTAFDVGLRPFVWQSSDRLDRSQPAGVRSSAGDASAGAAIGAGGDARKLHQELVRRARARSSGRISALRIRCRSPTHCRAVTSMAWTSSSRHVAPSGRRTSEAITRATNATT